MREQFVEVEGGRVWCGVAGEGPGDPLLCVHGGPGSTHDGYLALTNLGRRPFVFYDQLGSGKSDHPDEDSLWTLDRFVGEIDPIRKALGLERIHLLGGSWGGSIAAAYASQRPAGLRSVILSSPLISVETWVRDALRLRSELPDDIQRTLDSHEENGRTQCPEYVAASLHFYKRHVCRLDPWPEEVELMFERTNFDIYKKMWGPNEFTANGTLVGMDVSPGLSRIECPVLFMCGRHDEATPKSTAEFASLVPTSEVKVHEKSAHLAIFEETAGYLETIEAWLERADS
ncbi:MAG: proline iminopeptidase-family hydrolase [Actinomycetota bacterium]|nr:proline iminopeptidase-family hydrolase [Actinomycetota bacterium]